jgi:hypothetical protein
MCEPDLEALVGEQIEHPIYEILLQDVLLILVPSVLAMRHHLDLVLAGKDRPLDLRALEVHPERGKLAGRGPQAIVAPRAELDIVGLVAARGVMPQYALVRLLFLLVALSE